MQRYILLVVCLCLLSPLLIHAQSEWQADQQIQQQQQQLPAEQTTTTTTTKPTTTVIQPIVIKPQPGTTTTISTAPTIQPQWQSSQQQQQQPIPSQQQQPIQQQTGSNTQPWMSNTNQPANRPSVSSSRNMPSTVTSGMSSAAPSSGPINEWRKAQKNQMLVCSEIGLTCPVLSMCGINSTTPLTQVLYQHTDLTLCAGAVTFLPFLAQPLVSTLSTQSNLTLLITAPTASLRASEYFNHRLCAKDSVAYDSQSCRAAWAYHKVNRALLDNSIALAAKGQQSYQLLQWRVLSRLYNTSVSSWLASNKQLLASQQNQRMQEFNDQFDESGELASSSSSSPSSSSSFNTSGDSSSPYNTIDQPSSTSTSTYCPVTPATVFLPDPDDLRTVLQYVAARLERAANIAQSSRMSEQEVEQLCYEFIQWINMQQQKGKNQQQQNQQQNQNPSQQQNEQQPWLQQQQTATAPSSSSSSSSTSSGGPTLTGRQGMLTVRPYNISLFAQRMMIASILYRVIPTTILTEDLPQQLIAPTMMTDPMFVNKYFNGTNYVPLQSKSNMTMTGGQQSQMQVPIIIQQQQKQQMQNQQQMQQENQNQNINQNQQQQGGGYRSNMQSNQFYVQQQPNTGTSPTSPPSSTASSGAFTDSIYYSANSIDEAITFGIAKMYAVTPQEMEVHPYTNNTNTSSSASTSSSGTTTTTVAQSLMFFKGEDGIRIHTGRTLPNSWPLNPRIISADNIVANGSVAIQFIDDEIILPAKTSVTLAANELNLFNILASYAIVQPQQQQQQQQSSGYAGSPAANASANSTATYSPAANANATATGANTTTATNTSTPAYGASGSPSTISNATTAPYTVLELLDYAGGLTVFVPAGKELKQLLAQLPSDLLAQILQQPGILSKKMQQSRSRMQRQKMMQGQKNQQNMPQQQQQNMNQNVNANQNQNANTPPRQYSSLSFAVFETPPGDSNLTPLPGSQPIPPYTPQPPNITANATTPIVPTVPTTPTSPTVPSSANQTTPTTPAPAPAPTPAPTPAPAPAPAPAPTPAPAPASAPPSPPTTPPTNQTVPPSNQTAPANQTTPEQPEQPEEPEEPEQPWAPWFPPFGPPRHHRPFFPLPPFSPPWERRRPPSEEEEEEQHREEPNRNQAQWMAGGQQQQQPIPVTLSESDVALFRALELLSGTLPFQLEQWCKENNFSLPAWTTAHPSTLHPSEINLYQLSYFLQSHIVQGVYSSIDFKEGMTMTTWTGQQLTIGCTKPKFNVEQQQQQPQPQSQQQQQIVQKQNPTYQNVNQPSDPQLQQQQPQQQQQQPVIIVQTTSTNPNQNVNTASNPSSSSYSGNMLPNQGLIVGSGKWSVGGATILSTDISSKNAMIHLISKPLSFGRVTATGGNTTVTQQPTTTTAATNNTYGSASAPQQQPQQQQQLLPMCRLPHSKHCLINNPLPPASSSGATGPNHQRAFRAANRPTSIDCTTFTNTQQQQQQQQPPNAYANNTYAGTGGQNQNTNQSSVAVCYDPNTFSCINGKLLLLPKWNPLFKQWQQQQQQQLQQQQQNAGGMQQQPIQQQPQQPQQMNPLSQNLLGTAVQVQLPLALQPGEPKQLAQPIPLFNQRVEFLMPQSMQPQQQQQQQQQPFNTGTTSASAPYTQSMVNDQATVKVYGMIFKAMREDAQKYIQKLEQQNQQNQQQQQQPNQQQNINTGNSNTNTMQQV